MAIVKSADRVIQILETIALADEGCTHRALSEILAIPKGSLSLLLSNLIERDYVTFDPSSKRYRLGPRLLVLTGRYLSGIDLLHAARPILRKLVAEINEDGEIAAMKDTEIIILHKEDCSRPFKYSIAVGDRGPMYATAAGKAILAYLTEDQLSRYLSLVKLIPFTRQTITNRQLLMRALDQIRSTGLAYGRDELYEGVSAIAAPIFNLHREITASIVVTLPTERFKPDRRRIIEPRLRRAAEEISRQLGFEAEITERARNRIGRRKAALE
ncbi:MAG: IclR family transcriptional regulator [candidate division WOR-3 bacterium]